MKNYNILLTVSKPNTKRWLDVHQTSVRLTSLNIKSEVKPLGMLPLSGTFPAHKEKALERGIIKNIQNISITHIHIY